MARMCQGPRMHFRFFIWSETLSEFVGKWWPFWSVTFKASWGRMRVQLPPESHESTPLIGLLDRPAGFHRQNGQYEYFE